MGGAVVDEADDVVEGRVVAELERVVAFDAVDLADGGEHFGLLDGVDAEVGFEVEVHVEQFGRVAGLFGDDREHAGGDAVVGGLGRRCGRGLGRCDRGCGLGRRGGGLGRRCGHGLGRFDRGCGLGRRGGGRGGGDGGRGHRGRGLSGRGDLDRIGGGRRGGRDGAWPRVDDAQPVRDDLEPRRRPGRSLLQPAAPDRLVRDAVGVPELLGVAPAAVAHRRPAQQQSC